MRIHADPYLHHSIIDKVMFKMPTADDHFCIYDLFNKSPRMGMLRYFKCKINHKRRPRLDRCNCESGTSKKVRIDADTDPQPRQNGKRACLAWSNAPHPPHATLVGGRLGFGVPYLNWWSSVNVCRISSNSGSRRMDSYSSGEGGELTAGDSGLLACCSPRLVRRHLPPSRSGVRGSALFFSVKNSKAFTAIFHTLKSTIAPTVRILNLDFLIK